MRYNARREKIRYRNVQFERYIIRMVKESLEVADDKKHFELQRTINQLPDKLKKVFKKPETTIEFLSLEEQFLLLERLNKPIQITAYDKGFLDEIGASKGCRNRFSAQLRKRLNAPDHTNPFRDSFTIVARPVSRFYGLVGTAQSSVEYFANHDWKKIKEKAKTSQDKKEFENKKLTEFIDYILNFGIFGRHPQKFVGLTELEILMLMYVANSPELTITKKKIAQKFTGEDKSSYTTNAIHALVRKGYIINEPIERKAQEKYLATTKGWDLIFTVLESVLK